VAVACFNQSPLSIANVMSVGLYVHFPIRLNGVALRHRENCKFTFSLHIRNNVKGASHALNGKCILFPFSQNLSCSIMFQINCYKHNVTLQKLCTLRILSISIK
jgi:hypothetical protein